MQSVSKLLCMILFFPSYIFGVFFFWLFIFMQWWYSIVKSRKRQQIVYLKKNG